MTQIQAQRIVLVDDAGARRGTALLRCAHHKHTPLHLAVHAYLFDDRGRLLLSRRGLDKATWAGVWSNTCCGHVRPGETVEETLCRTAVDELGTDPRDLRQVIPAFRYRAVDIGGLVENELCAVMVGRIDADEIDPDPEHVADTMWISWKEMRRLVATTPAMLTPWAVRQVPLLAEMGVAPPRARVTSEGRHVA